jgi:hypothetical protein
MHFQKVSFLPSTIFFDLQALVENAQRHILIRKTLVDCRLSAQHANAKLE